MEPIKLNFTATYESLDKYVDQLYNGFVPEVYGKIKTLEYINLIPNVDYSKIIPDLNSTLVWSDGGSCNAFDGAGSTSSFTGRVITTCMKHAEEALCLDEMSQYYFGPFMKNDYKSIPFEESFLRHKEELVAKQLDTFFWNGDGNCLNSITAIATTGGATGLTAVSLSLSTAVSNGIILTIDNVIAALPADYTMEDDLVIFVGRDLFDTYVRSWRNIGNYFVDYKELEGDVLRIPGKSNIRMVATVGLNGKNKGMLGKASFMHWGADKNFQEEGFDGEYNFRLRKYLLRFTTKIGSQVSQPESFVVFTSANTIS